MTEILFFVIPVAVCAFVFDGIAVWAFVSRAPVHFWAGSKVLAAQVSDVRRYNRAVGVMWLVFAGMILLSGVVAFWSVGLAGVVVGAVFVVGIPVMVLLYRAIWRKYVAE